MRLIERESPPPTSSPRACRKALSPASIGWLDMLTAQSGVLATRASDADSFRRPSLARADLLKSLGGGRRETPTTDDIPYPKGHHSE